VTDANIPSKRRFIKQDYKIATAARKMHQHGVKPISVKLLHV